MSKKETTKETKDLDKVLNEIWPQLDAKTMGWEDFNKFRQYKRRYEQGTLGEKAIRSLLEYFNYEIETTYIKK